MYKILKGFHFCLALPRIVRGSTLRKTLRFTESCKYDLKTDDQYDWNKLLGLSLGLIGPSGHRNPVHWNSVRLGWRYDTQSDLFEVCAYCYKDGIRLEPVLVGKFSSNQSFSAEFLPDDIDKSIHIRVNGQIVYTYTVSSGTKVGEGSWGWMLRPYFGGNRTSPHKMVIRHSDI
jgi:hypothetical protein